MIHSVNASGLSAYNPVERRLAPLSKAASGVVIPHDSHGMHLDSAGNTTDIELEKKNFKTGGLGLCDVWSEVMINGYKVDCKWMDDGCKFIPEELDPSFAAAHAMQTRFGLQIVKCSDLTCCEPFRSNWMKMVPDRFLPAPAIYEYSPSGQRAVEPSKYFTAIQSESREEQKKYKFAGKAFEIVLEYYLLP